MTKLTEGPAPIGAQATLYTTAAAALRGNNIDVAKALPAFVDQLKSTTTLLTAIATNYLSSVAADMRNAARTTATGSEKVKAATPSGHTAREAQASTAGGHPSTAAEAVQAEGVSSPRQAPHETQISAAGAHLTGKKKTVVHARGREGPHRRRHLGRPTDAQRRAEIAVDQRTTLFDSWRVRGNRKIGDLFVHELRTLALEGVKTGFGFVVRGKEDIIDGAVYQLIAQHVQTSDPMARVRDVINEATLKRFKAKAIKISKKAIDRVNQMPREILTEIAKGESQLQIEQ
jgi:hypothetical protein